MTLEELEAWAMSPDEPPPVATPEADLEAWAAAPDEAAVPNLARARDGRVYVRAPSGELGTVAENELQTLGEGYKLADPREVSQAIEGEEYGDAGSQFAAGLEGVAQGATMNLYGLAASQLSPEYNRERLLREQHNPGTAIGGQVVGTVLPALLSGGTGLVGTVARALPSAVEVNLGAKLAGALGERAAAWTSSKVVQAGLRATLMGAEGAADQAVRTVLDDAAAGDVEITAERMLGDAESAAWTGFATGAGLELGASAFGALGKAILAGARGLGKGLPASVSDAAGEAAYKAAVGRTDVRSQRLAQRLGGSAEVGKTLLRRELVSTGDTVDDIAARLPGARQAAGEELGALLDEVAGGTASKAQLRARVESVIGELDKPGQKDVAQALRSKLEASGIDDVLAGEGDIALGDLHRLRRAIDARPDLKWGSAGPNGVDLTTEGMRDVRRVLEDGFEEASDAFAKSTGSGDYLARLKQAKREYSHLALAADQAEEGAMRRLANNRMGLNDVLAGVGGAAAGDPTGGIVSGLASKFARDRFESTAASLLYRLSDDAVRTQQALTKHADDTVRAIFSPETRERVKTALTMSANTLEHATSRALALQDPSSPEAQSLVASLRQVAKDGDPALAGALAHKVKARADFIASKTPPRLDPSDPLGATPGQLDGMTARRAQRYTQAALDPMSAIQRLSHGEGSAEDLETVRALTPRLYQAYVRRVQESVLKQPRPPTPRERQRIAYVTGVPTSASDTPQAIAWFQSIKTAPEPPVSNNPNLAPAQQVRRPSPPKSNRTEYATRTDRVLAQE